MNSLKTNFRVLVLGHKGMLGNAVFKYFSSLPTIQTLKTESRYPEDNFLRGLSELEPDFIVNCIGAIPQKKSSSLMYQLLNYDLPKYLDGLNIPVVHPSTDCEFCGNIQPGREYEKHSLRDAEDEYGQSKGKISEWIESTAKNTKIIRTSIIGHQVRDNTSLLDWFLSQSGEVKGFSNHYWNGITTLEWAKLCRQIIENWNEYPKLNQFGTKVHNSKYELLLLIRKAYDKKIDIQPFSTEQTINKCLQSDTLLPEIEIQLSELRNFYKIK